MTEPLLQVSGLKTVLGSSSRPVRVVDGVDLSLWPGETCALLGESGCGKSMTALSLMRLLPPSGRVCEGRVVLEGTDLLVLPEERMRRVRGGRMGMIFQEPQTSLNPVMNVLSQVGEAVRLRQGGNRHQVRRRVLELLNQVGIPDPERRAGEYPHQLSGGLKQRVMIAMALAGRPRLLIADEPTTALDVTIQAQVLELLNTLQRESGMAVLLITHDLGVVAETADRLYVMYAGEIVEEAPAEAFFAGPAHPYSRQLLASLPGAEKRGRRLAVIPGMVPPLDGSLAGCRFAPRCDSVLPQCRLTAPDWADCGDGQRVRCHLWSDGRGERPASAVLAAAAEPAQHPMSSPLLRVRELRVYFPIQRGVFRRTVGHVRAVDGLSLDLATGRTLALVGESGCGKTTAGKAILQLPAPTGGSVEYAGTELTGLSGRRLRSLRREAQIIFQDPFGSMNPRMLVGDIVEEGMLVQGLEGNRERRRARVRELLEKVGVSADAVGRYPHEFSGGQRQRICIARSLAVNPRLIVCDEPTSALDVSVQAQILNLLKDIQSRLGIAYLFITHDISVVAYMAHEVAVMYLGRIVERGTVTEVLESPAHPYTRALLSAVPKVGRGDERAVIRLEGDLPSPANPPAGCHFHPRCPQAVPECRHAYPAAVTLSGSHEVRCIRSAAHRAIA